MGLYEYDSTQDKLKLVAGSTNFAEAPIGAIYPFGGAVIPTSFLLCDGSAISRTDYAELFAVIGTAFGAGDGSTTFNIPDLRESVPKGAGETGQTVGAHVKSGGLAVGEFLDDRIQNHNIRGNVNAGGMGDRFAFGNSNQTSLVTMSSLSTNMRAGATTEVKSVGVNYIIKAKQVGMPADFASAVGDVVVDKNTYSTSETIVGKWIDDKPIYRKVAEITTGSADTSVQSVDMRSNSVDEIISIGGEIEYSSVLFVPINDCYIDLSSQYVHGAWYSNGYIYTKVGSYYANKPAKIIIEYTKTTDG